MVSERDEEYRRFVENRLDRLRKFGYLLCGDWHLAEDALQTTLVKLYVGWSRVSRTDDIDAYVRRMLVNCLADERRRGFLRWERPTRTSPDSMAVDHSEASDNRLVATEALRSLPPRQRAAVVLRYWEDLSVEQTASILNCSVGNVKSQCARGLRTMRSRLAEAGSFPAPEQGAR